MILDSLNTLKVHRNVPFNSTTPIHVIFLTAKANYELFGFLHTLLVFGK